MELRILDPRKLLPNPHNPSATAADSDHDAMLEASIKAVGIIQPPTVRPDGRKFQIIAGHRRVRAAIAAGLDEIHVLLCEHADGGDDLRSVSENLVRAPMNAVDLWRAINKLTEKNWTEPAIAAALALPLRTVQKLKLLSRIHPPMLDHIARGDMPSDAHLRTIAAAPENEQAAAWKKHKPRKDQDVVWHQISGMLNKRRMLATDAAFGDDLAKKFGVIWEQDLFAPADQDSRYTSDVKAFLDAQTEWLKNNLPKNGALLETDQWGSPTLPKGAERLWSAKPKKADCTGWFLDRHSGAVGSIPYRIVKAEPQRGKGKTAAKAAAAARPPITQNGQRLLGDLHTEALREALAEAPIEDNALMALLILGYAAANVQVSSARSGDPYRTPSHCQRIAARLLTETQTLTTDPAILAEAARDMLAHIFSCRQNRSNSGVVAKIAARQLGAETRLPNLATQEFLSCLSRELLEKTAVEHGIAPKPRLRDTREAIANAFDDANPLRLPLASIAPTDAELADHFSDADSDQDRDDLDADDEDEFEDDA